jgi:CBS domain-containing protein
MKDSHTVADALTQGVVDCPPQTSLRSAARLMLEHGIHAVYVIDEPNHWGLLSDIDVAAAFDGDLDGRTAGESAIMPLLTVTRDQPLSDAAALMARTGVTHLAVLDEANRFPIGVLSTLDVVRAVAAGERSHAHAGDEVTIASSGHSPDGADRRGRIVRVLGIAEHESYVVRWPDGRESVVPRSACETSSLLEKR